MNNLKKFNRLFSQYQKEVNFELGKFFNKKIKEAAKISKENIKDARLLKEYVLRGGKRLRPILLIVGYFLAGGKNKKEIFKTSLAVELIHNFLLIHDDIIDRDDFRRSKPSLHRLYQKIFKDAHSGISQAMVSGDIGNIFGYEILAKSGFPAENKIKAINILNEIGQKTAYGQMWELSLKNSMIKRKTSNEKNILKISQNKTAYYSFVMPLKVGMALAGGGKFLNNLEKFARSLGTAFQIQDDILGLFGSQKKIGKPIASDIKENQPNLLIFKTIKLANGKDRKKFRGYLNKEIKQKEIGNIKRIVKESGALAYCRQKAETFIKQAKYFLNKIKLPKKQKQFLSDLTDYINARNY